MRTGWHRRRCLATVVCQTGSVFFERGRGAERGGPHRRIWGRIDRSGLARKTVLFGGWALYSTFLLLQMSILYLVTGDKVGISRAAPTWADQGVDAVSRMTR